MKKYLRGFAFFFLGVFVAFLLFASYIGYTTYKAALDGDAQAQFRVGGFYGSVLKDHQRMVFWLDKAAENGSIQAQLIAFHYHGISPNHKELGFEIDYDKAIYYYELIKKHHPVMNADHKIDVFICLAKNKTKDENTTIECSQKWGVE